MNTPTFIYLMICVASKLLWYARPTFTENLKYQRTLIYFQCSTYRFITLAVFITVAVMIFILFFLIRLKRGINVAYSKVYFSHMCHSGELMPLVFVCRVCVLYRPITIIHCNFLKNLIYSCYHFWFKAALG